VASVLASRASRFLVSVSEQVLTAGINLRALAERAFDSLAGSLARARGTLAPTARRLAELGRTPVHLPFSRPAAAVSGEYPGQALVEAARSLAADFRSAAVAFCAARRELPTVSAEEERRRLIQERAYGLSRQRGAGAGSPENDWLTAEREVDERLQARPQRLKELGEAANTSATHVNVSFLTFMFVWTFVALAVSATTDEQLLRVSPLPMPLVGLKLPIVEFYAVAPYFILLLHLNLLLQLYLLSRRLHALDQALEEVVDPAVRRLHRLKLFPLPFSQFLVGHEPRRCIHIMLVAFVGVTAILMPLVLLSWLELRFLPYHHAAVPWFQRVAVILDALLVLGLWPLLLRRDEAASGTATALAWSRTGRATAWTAFVLLLVVFPAFSSLVALWPGEPGERWLASFMPSVLLVDPARMEKPLLWAPSSWYPGKRHLSATYWFFDRTGAWFRRNLSLSAAVLLAEKPDPTVLAALEGPDSNARAEALKHVRGIDLRDRNLVLGDFGHSVLTKADLRGVSLAPTLRGQTCLQRTSNAPRQISRVPIFGRHNFRAPISGRRSSRALTCWGHISRTRTCSGRSFRARAYLGRGFRAQTSRRRSSRARTYWRRCFIAPTSRTRTFRAQIWKARTFRERISRGPSSRARISRGPTSRVRTCWELNFRARSSMGRLSAVPYLRRRVSTSPTYDASTARH
jgi:Protein of unknown function (DUF2934)